MPQTSVHPLLDADAVSRAESLGMLARYIVEGYMAGEHKSPFRGFSVEFTQHRQYVPGDDIRHLDWKVLGRTDRQYIKQYEQETNYVAHLLLDGSASMKYGSTSVTKLAYGKQLAACLAYLILHQGDAVAVSVFDESVDQHVPRTGNLGSIHNIMSVLAGFDPKRSTNVAQVLHDLAVQVRRRGIVVLISDLFDDETKLIEGIQHLRFAGHEVIVFHLLDPYEIEFPFDGLVEFDNLESVGSKITTHPRDIRKSYLREFEAFCARVRMGCEKQQCHYVKVNTAAPLAEVLTGYLAFRQRTKRS